MKKFCLVLLIVGGVGCGDDVNIRDAYKDQGYHANGHRTLMQGNNRQEISRHFSNCNNIHAIGPNGYDAYQWSYYYGYDATASWMYNNYYGF